MRSVEVGLGIGPRGHLSIGLDIIGAQSVWEFWLVQKLSRHFGRALRSVAVCGEGQAKTC